MASNTKMSKQEKDITTMILRGTFWLIGWIITNAVRLVWRFSITVMWVLFLSFVLVSGMGSTTKTIILSIMLAVLLLGIFGSFLLKLPLPYWLGKALFPVLKFSQSVVPILADNERARNASERRASAEQAREIYYAAKLLTKDEFEGGVKPPATVLSTGRGSIVLKASNPVTAMVASDIERLTSDDAVNAAGLPYAIVDDDGTVNGSFSIEYTASVDQEILDANNILKDVGLTKNSHLIYAMKFVHNSNGDAVFGVTSKIGNMTKRDIANRVANDKNLAARYGSLYVKVDRFGDIMDEGTMRAEAAADGVTLDNYKDNVRVKFIVNVRPAVAEANDLLQSMGVIQSNEYVDAEAVYIEDEEWKKLPKKDRKEEDRYAELRIVLSRGIPGRPVSSLAHSMSGFADLHGARTVQGENEEKNGKKTGREIIRFIKKNNLDKPRIMKYENGIPAEYFNAKKMRVACGSRENGRLYRLTLSGNSGMVVGGQPGSGKTAGVTSFLLPMAISDDVELTVIDGKGGADWEAYKTVCSNFISGADNHSELRAISNVLKEAVQDMVTRTKSNKEKLGNSNFWNASIEARRKAGLPLKLIVIDECQEVFQQKTSRNKDAFDKTMNDYVNEITEASTSLIKRGRSSGVFLILMTQKPTVDSLPSSIRDNSGKRIAFRLSSGAAVQATLGSAGDAIGGATPLNIPNARKGGAVVVSENGDFEEVRFFYTPEDDQERIINSSQKAAKMAKSGGPRDLVAEVEQEAKALQSSGNMHGSDGEVDVKSLIKSRKDRKKKSAGLSDKFTKTADSSVKPPRPRREPERPRRERERPAKEAPKPTKAPRVSIQKMKRDVTSNSSASTFNKKG